MKIFSNWITTRFLLFSIIILICTVYFQYSLYFYLFYFAYTLGVYPLFAITYNLKIKLIKWYDPLCIGFLILSQMFLFTYLIILFDVTTLNGMSFGGTAFSNSSLDDKVFYLFKAQFIISIFSNVLLFSNRSKISYYVPKVKNLDRSFSKGLLLIFIPIFFSVFINIKYLLINLATENAISEEGNGVNSILLRGCLFFTPYILLSIFQGISFNKYMLICFFISIIEIPLGSRSGVLYFIIFSLFYYGAKNDFQLNIKKALLPLIFVFIIIFGMTIMRIFNRSHLYDSVGYTNFSDVVTFFDNDSEESNSLLLTSDRIKPLALTLKYLDYDFVSYSYGETIFARPFKVINIISRKFYLPEINLKTADEYAFYWRFGDITNEKRSWSVPMSVPGEFYFQFGFLSLLLLSVIFGKVVFHIRKKIFRSKSNFQFSLISMVLLHLLKSISSELMFYSTIYILVLPLFILFYLFFKFFYRNYSV